MGLLQLCQLGNGLIWITAQNEQAVEHDFLTIFWSCLRPEDLSQVGQGSLLD